MIQVVRVQGKIGDPRGEDLAAEIRSTLGIVSVEQVRTVKVYRLENVSVEQADTLAHQLLADPISQSYSLNQPTVIGAFAVREVAYKPGVMNPEVASILKSAADLGITELVAADTSYEYHFFVNGSLDANQLKTIVSRLLVNKTVQRVLESEPTTLLIGGQAGPIRTIAIRELDDLALIALSAAMQLHLNLEEMRVIQEYFRDLGRDPRDAELETLAQTWSEHCGHKTFKAKLVVNGVSKPPLMSRLKAASMACESPIVLSSFVDNSGVIRFDEKFGIAGKVETHNSPSAIEPRGGAMTGSGGVFRDVMGTGRGARVIASTDIFCFAPPDLPDDELPKGCLHPRYLLRQVVGGVRDYGNPMGVPTLNGSVHFHSDFRAKPTVIVGAYGLIPIEDCQKGEPQIGDLIVTVGGKTGRDGVHGATFSSGEMTPDTIENASVVQIGNPIEEKRTSDALINCRDAGLIRAVTDCGAGGFSSAIGEMGSTIGARVNLEEAPLKYSGLAPWEIWVSESQERMVVAVPPESLAKFLRTCKGFNVEATTLGAFTGDGQLLVTYNGEVACDLPMSFLHDGLPQRTMKATWIDREVSSIGSISPDPVTAYHRVMAHLDVASKEPIVRMYDHSVQGSMVLPPFVGVFQDGPTDAAVLQPLPNSSRGIVISHGLNPVLDRIHPYWGSVWAIAEALSNYVAVGGYLTQAALIDNFIWPFPDEESLGELDQAVDACVDIMRELRTPFVSGKDSLSSTYRYPDGSVLKIPPVLCVSAFGSIDNVERTKTSDFKKVGSAIILVGRPDFWGMGGSVYSRVHNVQNGRVPRIHPSELAITLRETTRLLLSSDVLACHDVSEGGVGATIAEMCFGGNLGAVIDLSRFENKLDLGPLSGFFNETAGCFVVEARQDLLGYISDYLTETPWSLIGITQHSDEIVVEDKSIHLSVSLSSLKNSWQQPVKEVFHS
ncbi:MAG: AIR synthase-related protein [Candidatus Berkelbacteria bacterium]|nr:AIR synthase-related protein [Candidatus Berkelbacteria bacterium]MCR4307943.1 AIR synthase-related protein [Candidatus Berkelbacteria bacterium]